MTDAHSHTMDFSRRGLLAIGTAAGLGVLGAVPARAESAPSTAFPPLRQIDAGALSVGYVDMGPPSGAPVIQLHGWPYDSHSFADAAPLLAQAGHRVIIPYLRGYGSTAFRSPDTMRNAQQSALGRDVIDLMDALKLPRAILGGFDWGGRAADVVAALWPERCAGLVSVSGYLIAGRQANAAPGPPQAELAAWYQFYFATERGRLGYERNRRDFNKLIWRSFSPQWRFDDATYERSARAFDNPDHVAIVIHSYRWRLGLAEGEARYDAYEQKLAALPAIATPAITLEGDANGGPHPQPEGYRARFTGPYAHRLITGGVGHNLPQEAPAAFADAVLAVSRQA
ncbi:MAG: alpha/beta fold hydrolase [Caulobacteraceae bacterium]